MEKQIIEILKIAIGIIIPIAGGFATKAFITLGKKIAQEIGDAKEKEIEAYASVVVKYIEQKFVTESNEEKLSKAIATITAKYGLTFITADEIEILIESAVADLKLAQNLPVDKPTPLVTPVEVPTK